MPTLICDLRPQAAELVSEYRDLRAAGEALALLWPRAGDAAPAEWVRVGAAAALDAAWEDERIALIAAADLPEWLVLEDFHRVLLVSAAATRSILSPAEARLVEALLCAGAEAVELVPAGEVRELAQSWYSGRRTNATRLTNSG